MKKEKKNILPGAMLAALAASVIVYCIMLNVEKNALSGYEKEIVLTAVSDLPKGMAVTQENLDSCFREQEMEKNMIPDGAVTDRNLLEGQMTAAAMSRGTIVTECLLEDLNLLKRQMKEPVTAGFKADDLYQVVSGTLRSGDRIHIYTVDEETESTCLIWEDVFVQEVFDSTGKLIPAQDTTTPAQRVNILIEKDSVEQFYSELTAGSLRVVKAAG